MVQYKGRPIMAKIACTFFLCDKMFKIAKELEEHKKKHRLTFKCDMCDKNFSGVVELKEHKGTHGQNKRKREEVKKEKVVKKLVKENNTVDKEMVVADKIFKKTKVAEEKNVVKKMDTKINNVAKGVGENGTERRMVCKEGEGTEKNVEKAKTNEKKLDMEKRKEESEGERKPDKEEKKVGNERVAARQEDKVVEREKKKRKKDHENEADGKKIKEGEMDNKTTEKENCKQEIERGMKEKETKLELKDIKQRSEDMANVSEKEIVELVNLSEMENKDMPKREWKTKEKEEKVIGSKENPDETKASHDKEIRRLQIEKRLKEINRSMELKKQETEQNENKMAKVETTVVNESDGKAGKSLSDKDKLQSFKKEVDGNNKEIKDELQAGKEKLSKESELKSKVQFTEVKPGEAKEMKKVVMKVETEEISVTEMKMTTKEKEGKEGGFKVRSKETMNNETEMKKLEIKGKKEIEMLKEMMELKKQEIERMENKVAGIQQIVTKQEKNKFGKPSSDEGKHQGLEKETKLKEIGMKKFAPLSQKTTSVSVKKDEKAKTGIKLKTKLDTKGYKVCDFFLCDKNFKSVEELTSHKQQHRLGGKSSQKYSCNNCKQDFKSDNQLKLHIKGCHQKKILVCSRCDKTFGKEEHLKQHRRAHG